ncbi:MAG: O-acetyl-ADP-ribose deacetylase [Magnetococcus sp. DMHC-6]
MPTTPQTTPIVEVLVGDITQLNVDAIVNAANSSLLGGGGVDGAIHQAGGAAILAECRAIRAQHYPQGLPTGKAVITTGGHLPAPFVIHTVGPIYHTDPNPSEHLTACYQNALTLAHTHQLTSVAFPNISTGAYGYPKTAAAQIAIHAIRTFLNQHHPTSIQRILLVAFSESDAKVLRQVLQA